MLFSPLGRRAQMRTRAPDIAPAGPAPAPDVQVSSNALAAEPGVILPARFRFGFTIAKVLTLTLTLWRPLAMADRYRLPTLTSPHSRPLHRMRELIRHAQVPGRRCKRLPRLSRLPTRLPTHSYNLHQPKWLGFQTLIYN